LAVLRVIISLHDVRIQFQRRFRHQTRGAFLHADDDRAQIEATANRRSGNRWEIPTATFMPVVRETAILRGGAFNSLINRRFSSAGHKYSVCQAKATTANQIPTAVEFSTGSM
jgi:hypothetical protein